MKINEAKERQMFEAWAVETLDAEGSELDRNSDGVYQDEHLYTLWLGWIARCEWTADREPEVPR